ncbi:Kunitz/Bovine pancreatic trypsin inhibitor domain protein [Ostertagia ostertagi]
MSMCDARGCFCVAANNGLVAFDTRTANNMTLPKCSMPQRIERSLYWWGCASWNLRAKMRCYSGRFMQRICNGREAGVCYCVVQNRSESEARAREKKETNTSLVERTTFRQPFRNFPSLKDRHFSKSVIRLQERRANWTEVKVGLVKIKSPPRYGVYYFDYRTFACLAFEYLGCGGNENNYPTSSACSSDFVYQQSIVALFVNNFSADLSGCSGMYPPARYSNGQAILCGAGPQMMFHGTTPSPKITPKLNEDGCPLDHKCVMGAFFGFCCNRANEDRFNVAYHPKCNNSREPYSEAMDSWREIRFGKSCKDNFCPSGYKCHDADIFAYCC